MTTYFVSRHPGAIKWAAGQDLGVDQFVLHLDLSQIHPGDTVIGSLPVNLAAQVCAAGVAYRHLSLDLPAELRGCELNAEQLLQLGAKIEPFDIQPLTQHASQLRMAQGTGKGFITPGISVVDALVAGRGAEAVQD